MKGLLSGEDPNVVFQASEHLRQGGLVAVPTETVYGLAADALQPEAVRRVFEVKGRPLIDPLIVHVRGLDHADELAHLPPLARHLAETFWPGPLTLVVPKKPCVPDTVTAGKPTVALRSPAHPVMRALLEACGLALAAPSANPFAYISPTCAAHVADSLGERIDLILDGGPCIHGLESTIVDLSGEHPRLLRPGPLLPEALEAVLGQPLFPAERTADHTPQAAPGMLARHYSPRTPMTLCAVPHEAFEAADSLEHCALLYLVKPDPLPHCPGADLYWCAETPDLAEAGRQLFALMRRIDTLGYAHLFAEKAPPSGLGLTLNNRLRRAACPKASDS